jgi:hypothetical protein
MRPRNIAGLQLVAALAAATAVLLPGSEVLLQDTGSDNGTVDDQDGDGGDPDPTVGNPWTDGEEYSGIGISVAGPLLAESLADGNVPWSFGLEAGGGTGWPATDWIEDILLRQTADLADYDDWVADELRDRSISPSVLG